MTLFRAFLGAATRGRQACAASAREGDPAVRSATEATYQPTSDDPLIAGPMTIEASVSTVGQESALVTASFSVAPKLLALVPEEGRVGELVEITAVGLDPLPEKNAVVMLRAGVSPPSVVAAFEDVAPDRKSGRVRIPRGARSGPLSIRVNGIDSPEAPFFYVKTVVPKCGNLEDFDFAANGDIFAVYGQPNTLLRDPLCPAPLLPGAPSYALIIHENGTMDKVIEGTSAVEIMGSVVDKSGSVGAFVTRTRLYNGSYEWRVKWWKDGDPQVSVLLTGLNSAFSGCCTFNFPLDFDKENRLYLIAQNRLARVTIPVNDDLPDEPEVTRPIEFIGPTYGFEAVFAIDCDNKAYVAHHYDLNTPPNYIGYNLTRVDLKTGAGTAIEGAPQRWALDMDVSCSAGKVYISQFTTTYGILDVEVVQVGPLGASILGSLGDVDDNPLLRIGPQGELLMTVGDFDIGYRYRPGGGRTMVALDVEPIAGCDSEGPLAFCTRVVDKLEILPATTRWKSQRSDAPMKIVFSGPVGLDLPTVRLEVVAPGEAGAYVPTLGPVALAAGKTSEYEAEWRGPWTYPVQTGTSIEQVRLPRGNYTLRVKGKKIASSLELTSPDYTKASLVEVTAVEIRSAGAPLDLNPEVPLHLEEPNGNRVGRSGGGWRIFAEAPNPTALVQDQVLVEVTIEPQISAAVTVQLKLIDVDDPDGAPIDKDEDKGDVADNNGSVDPAANVTVPSQAASASSLVRLSHHPGDNFRVAASTSRAWVDTLKAVQPSLTGQVTDAEGGLLKEKQQLSEMITVWRHLNLEIDLMSPAPTGLTDPERNFVEGEVTEIISDNFGGIDRVVVKSVPNVPGMRNLADGSPDRSGFGPDWGDGRFQNGRVFWGGDENEMFAGTVHANGADYIEPFPRSRAGLSLTFTAQSVSGGVLSGGKVVAGRPKEGQFKVRPRTLGFPALNTEPVLLTIGATTWNVPAGGIGQEVSVSGPDGPELEYDIAAETGRVLRFRLLDDDQAEAPFNIDMSLLQSTNSAETNVFAPAYLVPRVFQGPGGRIAPFNRNVECPSMNETDCDAQEAHATLSLGRDVPQHQDGFLYAFLLGAFQGPEAADGDPFPDGGERENGRAFSLSQGAMVYLETRREGLEKCWSQTPAHEIGHLLGLSDVEGDVDLMGPCRVIRSSYLSSEHVQLIRKMVQP